MHVRVGTVGFLFLAWLARPAGAHGQVPRQAAADSIGHALRALTARLDSIEAGACPSGPAIAPPGPTGEPRTDSLAGSIETLSRRLETIRAGRCPAGAGAAPPAATDTASDLAGRTGGPHRNTAPGVMQVRLWGSLSRLSVLPSVRNWFAPEDSLTPSSLRAE